MKKDTIIRFSRPDFEIKKKHLSKSGKDESFLYGLFSKAKGHDNDIYICKQLILPDDNELKNQSPVSIEPDQKYQSVAYSLAYGQGLTIIDSHTHPFSQNAGFSGIDNHHGTKNAKYISENFPESTTMGMIVFGEGFDNFEAQIWNRKKRKFESVNRIEILGTPTTILVNNKQSRKQKINEQYARHLIIPGWDQGLLENLKVLLCGLGGNGSLIFDSLLSLGFGSKKGWIKACDPDILEKSNLPRIPYAYPEEVGCSKADIAQIHANNRTPHLNVCCYQKSIEENEILNIAKEANIIIGAVDNDGARQMLNSIAARYSIPLLDIGTEIIPQDSIYEAVGQVQVFIPGQTGCFVCSGTIDPCQAAMESMSKETETSYEKAGYVRGSNETPTPSVLHLNGVTSHLAISQLLKLLFDDNFKGTEFLHYNRQKTNLLTASISPNEECPVCGVQGYLGSGDEDIENALKDLSDLKNNAEFETAESSA